MNGCKSAGHEKEQFGRFSPKVWAVTGLGLLSIQQVLGKKSIITLEQPDFAPCDFFLFPKLKEAIKKTYFESIEAVKRAVIMKVRASQKILPSSAKKNGRG